MRKILSLVLGLMWALPSWGALPTGYTQLEYINMPAGAYLLTDIIPVYDGHYEIDFQITEIQNSSAIFSGRTATYGGMLFTVASSGKFVVDAFGADSTDRYSSTVLPAANTRYKFIFNNKVATLESGDSRLFEHTFTGTGANGAVLVIKGTNSNGSIVGNNANYYIYSFQAWNPQGTLIANFVPAKNSSGVIGMYDTVNNRFYTNAGTGEFVAGDPVTEIKIATTKYNESAFGPLNTALANAISVVDSVVSNTITQAGRIATLQTQKQTRPNDIADDNEKCPAGKKCLLVEDASGVPHWYEIVENPWDLPVGYTQLQWIESTGEQYLDLGYAISKTMSFEIKSRCLGAAFVFGGRASSSSAVSGMNYDESGSKIGIRMGSVILYDTLVWQEGTDYTVSIQNGNVSIDGRTVSSATYGNDYYTGKAYLFATNDNGHLSPTVYNKNRIYYFKMYNNNTLTQNLIPAKNASGVVGMYDTVSGTFFENKGTGEFVAGPVAE